jgi:ribonuclease D
MDKQTLALLIPITAIVMGTMLKLAKVRLEETKARAGVLPDGALAELDQVRGEMEQMRHELAEVQERLDFTERLLAQRRDQERLLGGS